MRWFVRSFVLGSGEVAGNIKRYIDVVLCRTDHYKVKKLQANCSSNIQSIVYIYAFKCLIISLNDKAIYFICFEILTFFRFHSYSFQSLRQLEAFFKALCNKNNLLSV